MKWREIEEGMWHWLMTSTNVSLLTNIEIHMQRKRSLSFPFIYFSRVFIFICRQSTIQQASSGSQLLAQGPKVLGRESFPGVLLTRITVSLRFPSSYIKMIEIKAMSKGFYCCGETPQLWQLRKHFSEPTYCSDLQKNGPQREWHC